MLANQYNLGDREPNIQVWSVDTQGDRALTLRYTQFQGRPLSHQSDEVLKHLTRLWGFNVHLDTIGSDGTVVDSKSCIAEKSKKRT